MCSSDVPMTGSLDSARTEQSIRTWGRIDDEVIQIAPSYLREKLPDHPILLRSSPDYAVSSVLQQETDAHHAQSLTLIDIDWYPSYGRLVH